MSIEDDEGDVEIVAYNRAIVAVHDRGEADSVCCRLDDLDADRALE